ADAGDDRLERMGGDAAVVHRGRADRDHRDVRLGHRARGVGGGAQAAVGHLFGDQLLEPVLAQRRLAGIDLGDLVLVDVHADHRMTIPGQAGAGHATDVAEAEYRNIAHDFWDSLLEKEKTGAQAALRAAPRAITSRQIDSNWRAMVSLP